LQKELDWGLAPVGEESMGRELLLPLRRMLNFLILSGRFVIDKSQEFFANLKFHTSESLSVADRQAASINSDLRLSLIFLSAIIKV
jgi:hypothetical protein